MFNTYIGNYEEAIKDLNLSWKQHVHQSQQIKKETGATGAETKMDIQTGDEMYGKFTASQLVSPIASVQSYMSQNTDLSEVGLCTINVNEYNYNMLINCIQSQNWEQSLKKVNEIITSNPVSLDQQRRLKQLIIVRAMIYQELGQQDKFNQDMTVYIKTFSQIKNSTVLVEPYDSKGRLCALFEPITMNFTKKNFQIQMMPSFSMPFIKPPNMIPNIDEEIVQGEFNLKQIDAPMPEAPWSRTCLNQEFDPKKYLYELQEHPPKKQQYPKLPPDSKSQQFLRQYFQNDCLIYDEKVMEDVDDLSDTDKVSLISDIDL